MNHVTTADIALTLRECLTYEKVGHTNVTVGSVIPTTPDTLRLNLSNGQEVSLQIINARLMPIYEEVEG